MTTSKAAATTIMAMAMPTGPTRTMERAMSCWAAAHVETRCSGRGNQSCGESALPIMRRGGMMPRRMKVLLYPAWDKIEVAQRPEPSPGDGEVIVRVSACGLCGSELEAFKNHSPRRTPPLVLGHEFCGVVEALGPGVETRGVGLRVGRKVVSNSLVPCNQCVRCRRGDTHLCGKRQIFGMNRPGAFAERVAVPADCLIPWPDTLPAEAACLAEPLANGVHVAELVRPLRPKTVLVFGAGPIG